QAATCFRDRALIQPDDFQVCDSSTFRELESNQRPPGSEPGVTTSSNCPGADSLFKTTSAERSSGRRGRTFVSCYKARQPTASRSPINKNPRVPCGNRTRLSSLEGWRLCRSAKGT